MRSDPTSELPPLANRRPAGRKRAFLGCKIIYGEGRYSFPCTIRNISPTGARITFAPGESLPSSFYLVNGRERSGHRARVIWASNAEAGVELETTFPLHAIPEDLKFLRRFALRGAVN